MTDDFDKAAELCESSKKWIDDAPYEQLLQKWRFAPCGDPMFQGEIGKYYSDVMFRKRDELPHEDQVAASKTVGWEVK